MPTPTIPTDMPIVEEITKSLITQHYYDEAIKMVMLSKYMNQVSMPIVMAEAKEWLGDDHREDVMVDTYSHGVITKIKEGDKWMKNGKLHREWNLPAVIKKGAMKEWYVNGMLHRQGDKPASIHSRNGYWGGKHQPIGTITYYKNGKIHRVGDNPAVIDSMYTHCDGEDTLFQWWKNGKQHRDNGEPACISNTRRDWYINGERVRTINLEHRLSFELDGVHINHIWV